MIGRGVFRETNRALSDLVEAASPVIVAHRGSAGGAVVENTAAAVRAALACGADVVEIDLVSSRDGVVYVFHDGYERQLLGIDENLSTLSSNEIDELCYLTRAPRGRKQRVERVVELLDSVPQDVILNVDRSWNRWPAVLDQLARHGDPGRFILKSPPAPDHIRHLCRHPVKFPYVPVVTDMAQVGDLSELEGLNMVGVELVARDAASPLLEPERVRELHAENLLCAVNAEVLGDLGGDLYGGFDDWVSLLENPDTGWGELMGRDVDLVLTDWPWALRRYRDERIARGDAR